MDRHREALAAIAVMQGIGAPEEWTGIRTSTSGRRHRAGAGPVTGWAGLDPNARRRRIIDGCLTVLLQAAADKPLLVVLDDIHWTDADTDEVVARLLDALDGSRLLLVLGWRAGYRSVWAGHRALTRIALSPLSPANARDLARQVLGPRAANDAVVDRLADRTGGNPFFIEEAAAMPDLMQAPPSVRGVIGARLDSLDAAKKQFIEALATMGESASAPLLSLVLGTETIGRGPEVVGAELEGAGLLRIDGAGDTARFACRHSLLQEVAYGGLTRMRRRALHARIAAAMEQLAGDRAAEEAEVLARHARLGEDWEAALRHARAAGARAASHSANRAAVRFYEDALEALARLPQDADALSVGVDVRFALREPLFHIGSIASLRTRLDGAASPRRATGRRGPAWTALLVSGPPRLACRRLRSHDCRGTTRLGIGGHASGRRAEAAGGLPARIGRTRPGKSRGCGCRDGSDCGTGGRSGARRSFRP